MSWIFSKYVARLYTGWVTTMLCAFSFLIVLFDALELLRRARHRHDIDFGDVLKLALLHLPDLLTQIMPLVIFFATILMMRRFGRSGQLVAAKSAGSSIWQVMIPMVTIIGIYSTVYFIVLNPLGAVLTERYEKDFQRVFKGGSTLVTLAGSVIWARQEMPDGYALIKLGRIHSALHQVDHMTIYAFAPDNSFRERIDAAHANVKDSIWHLEDVVVSHPRAAPETYDELTWKTPLPFASVEHQFFPPNVISLWSLPSFVETLNQAGVSTIRHRLYWHTLLASPLMLLTMTLLGVIGAWRSMQRRENMALMTSALGGAFALYMLQTTLTSLGHSHQIPITLAAWLPPLVGLFLSGFWLLQLEED